MCECDVGASRAGQILEDVVLGEEEGLVGVVGAVDFDLDAQQVVPEYFDVVGHIVEFHVVDQPEMEFFDWRLVV